MVMLEQILKDNGIISDKETSSSYVVRCFNPSHTDTNPSMHINKHTGVFHCFSCKFKGNIFQHFGLEKPSKVNSLTNQCLELIEELQAPPGLEMPVDAEMIDFSYRGATAQTIAKYEMFTSDMLKEYFIFPIYDLLRNRAVFHGRLIDTTEEKKSKYLFYPRHKKIPLFPLYELNNADPTLVLVEGIFDMLSLKDIGVENCICMFGVSNFTKESIETLKILGIKTIICLLDNDKAGNDGAIAVQQLCEANFIQYYRPEEFPENKKDVAEMDRELRKQFIADCYESCLYRGKKEQE